MFIPFYDAIFMFTISFGIYAEDAEIFWNCLTDVEAYIMSSFIVINKHMPKVLYVFTNNDGVNNFELG